MSLSQHYFSSQHSLMFYICLYSHTHYSLLVAVSMSVNCYSVILGSLCDTTRILIPLYVCQLSYNTNHVCEFPFFLSDLFISPIFIAVGRGVRVRWSVSYMHPPSSAPVIPLFSMYASSSPCIIEHYPYSCSKSINWLNTHTLSHIDERSMSRYTNNNNNNNNNHNIMDDMPSHGLDLAGGGGRTKGMSMRGLSVSTRRRMQRDLFIICCLPVDGYVEGYEITSGLCHQHQQEYEWRWNAMAMTNRGVKSHTR